ncbi:MAG: 3-oxo-tetronate kinase [Betaproteobacteria bacterium]
MLLGCIGDDFTGSTDLANMLVRGGMRTIQTIGVPDAPFSEPVDACVVALKSRTIAAADAVAQSLAALAWLRRQGCRQFYFKYCSTFDSTQAGNIGPVTEALMAELADLPHADFTIACPAFPENGRTIFRGYLFTGDTLLSESGMKDHPLTPMTDSNLVRVLQAQSTKRVGLIRYDMVAQGAAAIRVRIAALRAEGVSMAVVDAVSDADLDSIAAACSDLPLVTAGSGIGLGLAHYYGNAGLLHAATTAGTMPQIDGAAAVVSGSCSVATNGQVAHWLESRPGFRIDPLRLAAGDDVVATALDWAVPRLPAGPVLVYATSDPATVKAAQASLGVERAGQLIETALGRIARGLVQAGVRKLVVAGGETSGAVVQALDVRALRIGPQIDPGVPWTLSTGAPAIALALKSGNFGTTDFFSKALRQVERR